MGEGTLCTVMLGYRFNTSEAIRKSHGHVSAPQ